MNSRQTRLILCTLVLAVILFPGLSQVNFRQIPLDKAALFTLKPVTEYPINTANSGPYAILAVANQTVWFTEYSVGKLAILNYVNGTIHEFSIPEINAQPVGLAVDSQSRVWIADENNPGKIWQFNYSSVTFQSYSTLTRNSTPFFVLIDKSDNIWFSELTGNNLGLIAHGSSTVVEYPLPTPTAGPTELAIENGTKYMWISESYANKLARFDMNTRTFQEFNPYPSLNYPLGIALDKAGNPWVAEHGGSSIAQFIISNSTVRKYPTAMATNNITAPATVSLDNAGRVWFVEHVSNKVGRLDPVSRTAEEFDFPTSGGYSLQGFGSTLDSKGNFWFTLFSNNAVAMIPQTATTDIAVISQTNSTTTATAGQTAAVKFTVTSKSSSVVTLSLNPTSTFSGRTFPTMSLSDQMVGLNPGQSKTVTITFTAGSNFPPGVYGIGLVATNGNSSTIGIAFVQVQSSLLSILSAYLPEILLVTIAVATLIIVLVLRKRQVSLTKSLTSPSLKLCIAVTMILGILWLGNCPVVLVNAKCPGLPPPPVQPNGTSTPDYFGLALDIASVGFFGIVAYLLIRDRVKRRKPPPSGPR